MPVRNSHYDVARFIVFLLSNRGGIVFWDERVLATVLSEGSDSHTFSPHHVILLLGSQEFGSRREVHHHCLQRPSNMRRKPDEIRSYRGRREFRRQRSRIPQESTSDQNDFIVDDKIERTKIQDHPNLPAVPLMKEIP